MVTTALWSPAPLALRPLVRQAAVSFATVRATYSASPVAARPSQASVSRVSLPEASAASGLGQLVLETWGSPYSWGVWVEFKGGLAPPSAPKPQPRSHGWLAEPARFSDSCCRRRAGTLPSAACLRPRSPGGPPAPRVRPARPPCPETGAWGHRSQVPAPGLPCISSLLWGAASTGPRNTPRSPLWAPCIEPSPAQQPFPGAGSAQASGAAGTARSWLALLQPRGLQR